MANEKNHFIVFDAHSKQINCLGEWKVDCLTELNQELDALSGLPKQGEIIINGERLKKLDSSGAWILNGLRKKLEKHGLKPLLKNFPSERKELIKLIDEQLAEKTEIPPTSRPNWLARVGKTTIDYLCEAREYLSFIGYLTLEALTILKSPSRIRFKDFVGIIEKTGYQALPIIALISFMVGIVLAHQMGLQLKNYGANLFIVDFLGYAALREFGPLITAIMVAGRTGSAFTAQIGIMKLNQEIDALDTMGITSAELLILPRLGGLLIALPLLTIWSDIFCILGGMIIANDLLHITMSEFLLRFQHQIPFRFILLGLAKAPIFALIIGSIGCFQGIKVGGSADSVGKQTTRSVVLAIFFIIVADALFSILFSKFNL